MSKAVITKFNAGHGRIVARPCNLGEEKTHPTSIGLRFSDVQKGHALAKKRYLSFSQLVRELIVAEAKREEIQV